MKQSGNNRQTAVTPGVASERAKIVRAAMQPLIGRLCEKLETVGVCILGSFALTGVRPCADIYSDFDIALFIEVLDLESFFSLEPIAFQRAIQSYLPNWLPNFKFVYPDSRSISDPEAPPLQINVHQLVISYEEQESRVWPADRREAFANTCDIVYDPQGRVAELIQSKGTPPPTEVNHRVTQALAVIPVTIEHSIEKCALRGALADSVLALSETIDSLLDLVYALNGKDLPHRKWRLQLVETLCQTPLNFRKRVEAILTESSAEKSAMLAKIKMLRELFQEVTQLCSARENVSDAYRRLVSEMRPGFQLRHHSLADEHVGKQREQYEKMKDELWNRANFNLHI